MTRQTEIDYSTLTWVKKELDETLRQAAESLERFVDDPDDRTQLQFCLTHLHQVYGILLMLELHGAAMLTEEMEGLAQALFDGEARSRDAAAEALMRAILQLRDYLERLEGGQRDAALLILPLVNELRAARGETLIAQSALFAVDLDAAPAMPRRDRADGDDLKQAARRMRSSYQRGLLAYLQGRQAPAALARMEKALDALDAAAPDDGRGAVWWVGAALVDALGADLLGDYTAAIRALLSRLERQMKAVAAEGAEAPVPSELLTGLLYYVARVEPVSERLRAVHEVYGLPALLREEEALERAREGVFGPGTEAFRSVAEAIREDLAGVKDTLDLFVRGSAGDAGRFADAAAAMGRIADTLGVLGLSGPRRVIGEEAELIRQLDVEDERAAELRVMKAAEALLYVESSLAELVSGEGGAGDEPASDEDDVGESLFRNEYRQVYGVALDEAIAEIGFIKEGIVRFLESHDHTHLAGLPERFENARGVLGVMGMSHAAELLGAAGRYVREHLPEGAGMPESEALDDLADAITSIEYHLEAQRDRRGPAEQILTVAENSLRRLGVMLPAAPETGDGSGTDAGEVADAPAVSPEHAGDAEAEPDPAPQTSADPGIDFSRKRGRVDLAVPECGDELDAEILDIFIEEADEVLATLRETFPRWRDNPDDNDALLTTRRMFHTLKGSGRLAGALLLGELAWSVENLLNRVLDRSVAPTPELFAVVAESIERCPALVDSLRGGAAADDAPVRALMRRAVVLGDPSMEADLDAPALPAEPAVDSAPAVDDPEEPAGDDPPASISAAGEVGEAEEPPGVPEPLADDGIGGDAVAGLPDPQPAAAEPEPGVDPADHPPVDMMDSGGIEEIELTAPPLAAIDEEATPEVPEPSAAVTEPAAVPAMDPTLYEIFNKETSDHLALIDAFLAHCAEDGRRCRVDDDLIRALHTLTGSARMADVAAIAVLGRRLEELARHRHFTGAELDAADREAFKRGTARIRDVVEALGRPAAEAPGVDDLLAVVDERLVASPEAAPEAAAAAPKPAAATTDATSPVVEPDVDEELVAVFLEEADDILGFLEETLVRWDEAADPGTPVAELQRSLHTLKGGARLAGFHDIGRLCHAIEELAVDVAAHRVPADDHFFDTLRAGFDQLAAMVEAAREGRPRGVVDPIIERIGELIGGEASVVEDGDTAELAAVFMEEAAEILAASESHLHAWRQQPGERHFVIELQRALHTLKGGARMAGFQPIADLGHALENLLRGLVDHGETPDASVFDTLEAANDRLLAMREAAAAGRPLARPDDLIEVVERLRRHEPVDAGAIAARPAEADAPAESGGEPAEPARRVDDVVRVRADLLDNLVNHAGEVSIYRARLDQQAGEIGFNLGEFGQTVSRLRDQLRTLEIETEAQILYRFEREHEGESSYGEGFDPLELDRFSGIQELSRALSESVNDLGSIQGALENLNRETETLLLQQSRVNTDLQDGLMRTRMVPFANLVPRMRRIVRQAAQELERQAQLRVLGAEGEMDRTVLERIIPPLEHMLRNAVAHGIETPARRAELGKPEAGTISVSLEREGADVVIRVADDGAGMDLSAIRRKAMERGLMPEAAPLTDKEVMQFVLESGFSTAERVTQIAGRGVGMDVVNAEIKQLGGNLEIDSEPGRGTRFIVRLPFTLALNQALLCQAGEEVYAIPLSSIEGVVRLPGDEVAGYLSDAAGGRYQYAGTHYSMRSLAAVLGAGETQAIADSRWVPVILVQAGDHRLALQVDGMLGSRDIVVKSVGPQISGVPGIFGATILADGRVVLILDVSALVRFGVGTAEADAAPEDPAAAAPRERPVVMVVDDSITMRRVATRLLERNGMEAITAKDGVDAVAALQETIPDAMLLDIEMPRMDGYELATHMRNDDRLRQVPIIMITSRTGEKHRQRARELGVDRYLGKPYQEGDLLSTLRELLGGGRGRQ